MDKNLGYKIRKIRELKGFKQEHVAKGLGIDKSTYSDIEAGNSKLTVERFKMIADILGYSPQAIEDFDDLAVLSIHNHQQGGNAGYNVIQNFSLEELSKLLVDPYKQQIAKLEDEIAFLRSLLQQQGKQ